MTPPPRHPSHDSRGNGPRAPHWWEWKGQKTLICSWPEKSGSHGDGAQDRAGGRVARQREAGGGAGEAALRGAPSRGQDGSSARSVGKLRLGHVSGWGWGATFRKGLLKIPPDSFREWR